MIKKTTRIGILIAAISTLVLSACKTTQYNKKPTIVLAAFGTSIPKAQAALEQIDTVVRNRFPNHTVHWAFTSQFILKKLRKNGQTTLFERQVPLLSLPEVYDKLTQKGIDRVVVQSLHVAPGQEFNDLLKCPTKGLQVAYGKPLLADIKKIHQFADVLSSRFGAPDSVTVLCGHGNDRYPE